MLYETSGIIKMHDLRGMHTISFRLPETEEATAKVRRMLLSSFIVVDVVFVVCCMLYVLFALSDCLNYETICKVIRNMPFMTKRWLWQY